MLLPFISVASKTTKFYSDRPARAWVIAGQTRMQFMQLLAEPISQLPVVVVGQQQLFTPSDTNSRFDRRLHESDSEIPSVKSYPTAFVYGSVKRVERRRLHADRPTSLKQYLKRAL